MNSQVSAVDILAKLLATENITVVRANAKTASFNVATRTLTIPLWRDMTNQIEVMMTLHEVGHALFTDEAEIKECMESIEKKLQRVLHSYFNVVEDARIERLMKERFPGSRKDFINGYHELMEMDFFGLKNRDIQMMNFIDRINIHFKAGFKAGIRFSKEEMEYVRQIENTLTVSDAFDLSKEIYEFAKSNAQNEQEEAEQEFEFGDEDDYYEPSDEDFDGEWSNEDDDEEDYDSTDGSPNDSEEAESVDSDEESEDSSNSQSDNEDGEDEDLELESETDKNLRNKLEDLADTSTEFNYFNIENMYEDNRNIVSFKTIIEETVEVDEFIAKHNDYDDSHAKQHAKFMANSSKMVNYLVKEFNMKKAATSYARRKKSRSGSLDMNKVYSYKINDDLFKRVTRVQEGKKHGMIFLLDWSGSMKSYIKETVEQVINLAMFCRRAQIPFEVYAFSSHYQWKRFIGDDEDSSQNSEWIKKQTALKAIYESDREVVTNENHVALLNLFSSKMSQTEFNIIARRFTSQYFAYIRGYNLGGTPLNESLIQMLDIIPAFKASNNIEKMTFITLTDGAGNTLRPSSTDSSNRWMPSSRDIDTEDGNIRIKQQYIIKDDFTKKTYEFNNTSTQQTSMLLNMIKDRYDVTNLGFYVMGNRKSEIYEAMRDNYTGFLYRRDQSLINDIKVGFRKEGFHSFVTGGRDELFFLYSKKTQVQDEEIKIDGNASAAAIARKFKKSFDGSKHSRVLLDKFIGHVA